MQVCQTFQDKVSVTQTLDFRANLTVISIMQITTCFIVVDYILKIWNKTDIEIEL